MSPNERRYRALIAHWLSTDPVFARAYALIGPRRVRLTLAERLLGWAGTAAMIALADVYQRGPYGLRDAKTARRIVGILEDHGYLVRVPGGAVIEGLQRRDVWRVWHAAGGD